MNDLFVTGGERSILILRGVGESSATKVKKEGSEEQLGKGKRNILLGGGGQAHKVLLTSRRGDRGFNILPESNKGCPHC